MVGRALGEGLPVGGGAGVLEVEALGQADVHLGAGRAKVVPNKGELHYASPRAVTQLEWAGGALGARGAVDVGEDGGRVGEPRVQQR